MVAVLVAVTTPVAIAAPAAAISATIATAISTAAAVARTAAIAAPAAAIATPAVVIVIIPATAASVEDFGDPHIYPSLFCFQKTPAV
jgi:hypothetical protein